MGLKVGTAVGEGATGADEGEDRADRAARLRRRRRPGDPHHVVREAGAVGRVPVLEARARSRRSRSSFSGTQGGGHGYAWGDVNGDGREDLLTEIGWYERPAGDPFAGPWKLHPETALPHPSCPFAVMDVNRDGRLDILFGKAHDYGLYWWEQQPAKADGTTVWKEHVIDESWSQVHAVGLADLDGDGVPRAGDGEVRLRAHVGRSGAGGSGGVLLLSVEPGADRSSCGIPSRVRARRSGSGGS